MPKIISGKLVIKILCRDFGFSFISQKGSHIKLAKKLNDKSIITIVPQHKELAYGTFKSILNLAQVDEQTFLSKL